MNNMIIAAIQTEHGSISYDGKAIKIFQLRETGGKVVEHVELESQEQTDRELQVRFGIDMDDCHPRL